MLECLTQQNQPSAQKTIWNFALANHRFKPLLLKLPDVEKLLKWPQRLGPQTPLMLSPLSPFSFFASRPLQQLQPQLPQPHSDQHVASNDPLPGARPDLRRGRPPFPSALSSVAFWPRLPSLSKAEQSLLQRTMPHIAMNIRQRTCEQENWRSQLLSPTVCRG